MLACRKCGADVSHSVHHQNSAGPGVTVIYISSLVVGETGADKKAACYFCPNCAPIVDDALQELGLLVIPAPSNEKTLFEARAAFRLPVVTPAPPRRRRSR